MADVGKAKVEVVGDVRNFARQTERDLNAALAKIRIDPVRLTTDSNQIKDEAQKAGETLGAGMAQSAGDTIRKDSGKISAASSDAGDKAGDASGKSFGRRFSNSAGQALGKMGKDLGSKIGPALKSTLSGIGDVIGPVLGKAGTAVAFTFGAAFVATAGGIIGPALAAAITAALGVGLGLGLIGIGVIALKSLKPVEKAFKGLGDTLKSVGREAAKPLLKPLLGSIEILRADLKFLQPQFQSIFKGIAPMVKPITMALSSFSANVLDGIKASLPGINAAMTGFARILPTVGKWLGDFFKTIFENEDLIDNTTEGIMRLVFGPLKLLGPIISGLNVLFGVWNNAVRLMADSNVFGQIGDQIMAFVDGGTGAIGRIKDAWGPLATAIQNVWDKLKAFAGEDDVGKLGTRFQEVVASIKAAWGPLKEFLGVVWEEALAFVRRLWDEYFVPWWEGTAKPWLEQAFRTAFEMAWNAAVSVVGSKLGQIRTRISNGINALPGMIRAGLASIPGIFRGALTSAHNAAISAIAALISGVVSRLRGLIGQARGALAGIRNAIVGAFAGAGGWLANAGSQIISGLLGGIRAGFGRVRGLLGELTSMLPNWKGPESVDKTILRDSGRMVMQGFERGLLDQRRAIRDTLGGLTGDLPSMSAGANKPYGTKTSVTGGITFNINVSGATGQDAGRQAAIEVLNRLSQAALVR